MPRARSHTATREKTSEATSAYLPSVITGSASLRRGRRGRSGGLSLVLARALGLELVGADRAVGGRVLADDDHAGGDEQTRTGLLVHADTPGCIASGDS